MTTPPHGDDDDVRELAAAVIGLRGALESMGGALQEQVNVLHAELEAQRRLSKYARRTWFEVMTWIALFAVMTGDLRGTYCDATAEPTGALSATCNTAFWLTQHGDASGWWRVLGLVVTAAGLLVMAKRSQVPEQDLRRISAYAEKEPKPRTWYRW